MSQHLIEGAIYFDASIFVSVSGPRELVRFIAADCDNFRAWHAIDQGVNMAFALTRISIDVESLVTRKMSYHAPKAGDGDVHTVVLHSGKL